jgi:hypothetical protein
MSVKSFRAPVNNETNDQDSERRRLWRQHSYESSRLREQYDAEGVDYRLRVYPAFPEEARGLTCGAITKRSGQPCKHKGLYSSGRCKFHGGASTGPRTEAGKIKAGMNGKKGGRPRKTKVHER